VVIDLVGHVIHVLRAGATFTLSAGDPLSPLALPDITLDVASLVG